MSAILHIPLPDIQGQPSQPLTSAILAAATSLPLPNTGGYTASKYLLIGGHKSPLAEIKLGGAVSSVTALAVAATSFAHSAGEIVQQIPYNQVEITYSENFETLWDSGVYATIADTATAATWATLGTYDLVPSQEYTTKKDDSTNSRVYRWRYKNSTDTIYSDYTNYQFPNGFERKSVAAIFRKSTNNLNKDISPTDVGQVTYELLFDLLNEGLEEQWSDKRRWSHDASFKKALGNITAGVNYVIIPSGIDRRNSDTPVWNLKIREGRNIDYIDKREWDLRYINVYNTLSASQLTSASSSWTLDSTKNLPTSGTVVAIVGTDKMEITYTANNKSTGVLTTPNCSTEVTTTIPVDTDVWMNASFGLPTAYTIFNGRIYFNSVPGEDQDGYTVEGDCYLACQQVDSLEDYVRTDNVNILINFVRNGVMIKTNNTELAGYFDSRFASGMKKLKRTESSGQRKYLVPRSWQYNGGRGRTNNWNHN